LSDGVSRETVKGNPDGRWTTPDRGGRVPFQGLPGWEPITAALQVAAETGRVNADAAKTRAAEPKVKRLLARPGSHPSQADGSGHIPARAGQSGGSALLTQSRRRLAQRPKSGSAEAMHSSCYRGGSVFDDSSDFARM
jgi:hypothetical protein